MSSISIVLEVIQAIGAIATAISVFIIIKKMRKKLIVSGEVPIRKNKVFVITVTNNTDCDSEIIAINLFKGSPRSFNSVLFDSIGFDSLGVSLNSSTNNIIVPSKSTINVAIPFSFIVNSYDKTVGEMIGKPFDTIYVEVKDNHGYRYYLNSKYNIDFYRKIAHDDIINQ